MNATPGAAPAGLWTAGRFGLFLGVAIAAGLAGLAAAAPRRGDLLTGAAAGAAFGGAASLSGYLLVARSAARSMEKAVQAFLAVMTGKVIAFAAFLLTLALTTSLNPVALAAGLVGATLVGECLVITSLRRTEKARDRGGH